MLFYYIRKHGKPSYLLNSSAFKPQETQAALPYIIDAYPINYLGASRCCTIYVAFGRSRSQHDRLMSNLFAFIIPLGIFIPRSQISSTH